MITPSRFLIVGSFRAQFVCFYYAKNNIKISFSAVVTIVTYDRRENTLERNVNILDLRINTSPVSG